MTAGDELVDHVDADDNVIAVVTRAEMRARALRHRAVYVLVVDRRGRVLVQQRSFAKDLAPGCWDIGAGGVVASGEAYDDAARRELAEELGVTGVPLEPLGPCRYDSATLHVVGRVYRAVHDGPFRFDDGEVVDVAWVEAVDLPAVVAGRPFIEDAPAVLLPHSTSSGTRTS